MVASCKIKELSILSIYWGLTFSFINSLPFVGSSHGGSGKSNIWGLFYRATHPIHKGSILWIQSYPKVHTFYVITLRVRILSYKFEAEEHKHWDHNTLLNTEYVLKILNWEYNYEYILQIFYYIYIYLSIWFGVCFILILLMFLFKIGTIYICNYI